MQFGGLQKYRFDLEKIKSTGLQVKLALTIQNLLEDTGKTRYL
jgi:hypothetical protein